MALTATFRNKNTGEVRNFTLEEAQAVGISPESFLAKVQTQQKIADIEGGGVGDPIETLQRKKAEMELKKLEETGGVVDEFAGKKQTALAAVKQLEKLYGRGSAENVGTKKDLSIAPSSSVFGKAGGKIAELTRKTFDPEYQEDVNIFKSALEATAGVFTQAFGSGTPQEAEAKRFMDSAPGPNTTNEEAKAWFENVKVFLGQNPTAEADIASKMTDQKKNLSDITAPTTLASTDADIAGKVSEPSTIQKIAEKISGAAPVVGGVIGGVGGGILGVPLGGVGALATGAAGTGIGTAAGAALGNMIEDLAGIQDQTPVEQVKEATVDAGTAAVLDFATAGLLKGAGAIAKPALQTVGKTVAQTGEKLALRAIRPSPSQQSKFLAKTGQSLTDFVIEKGLFKKGVEQVDNLIKPLQSQYDDITIKSGKTIPLEDLTKRFDSQIEYYKEIPTKEAQNLVKQLNEEKKLVIKQITGSDKTPKIFLPSGEEVDVGAGGDISIERIVKLRRKIDDLLSPGKFLEDPIRAGKNRVIRNIYKQTIDDFTEKTFEKGSADLGKELNKLYTFRDIAQAQEGLGKGTLPIGILKQIGLAGAAGAGTGYAVGGPIGSLLLAVGVPTLLNQPQVVSFLAKNLISKGAKLGVQEAGEKVGAKMSAEILRRLLTNIGAAQISLLGN